MDYKTATEQIITNLGVLPTDIAIKKHGKRHSTDWATLIRSFLELGSIKEVSAKLGYSDASLEQYMRRNISPLVKELPNRGRWKNIFLDLINYKYCNSCGRLLPHSNFSFDKSKLNLLHSTCKDCYHSKERTYTETSKEKNLLRSREHYKNNKTSYIARNAKRRAAKLQATPNWANLKAIKEIYATCPEGYHVDHIVPLQSDVVCGLHCEFNLQHLSAQDNLSKHNNFIPQ